MPELQKLYQDLHQRLFKFILKRNPGDPEAAQQILQDTFVSAFKSFNTFQHKSSYFTWLCKISLNKIADYYRQQIHSQSHIVIPTLEQFNALADPGLSPEEKLSLDELRANVNKCLNLIPPSYRQLLHFKYYQSLSTREICLRLNLTPRQVEGRLRRARKSLGKTLAFLYPEYKQ